VDEVEVGASARHHVGEERREIDLLVGHTPARVAKGG
jgi:hypothetical protein